MTDKTLSPEWQEVDYLASRIDALDARLAAATATIVTLQNSNANLAEELRQLRAERDGLRELVAALRFERMELVTELERCRRDWKSDLANDAKK